MRDAHCSSCSCCKGRPRSVQSETAILDATLQLLEDKLLCNVTIEAIAQKAGVGKATIYKWWPSKAALALDAFLTRTRMTVEIPDTGSAKTDFTESLKSLMRFFTSKTGRVFCQFIAECQIDAEFAHLFREYFLTSRRNAVGVILSRAEARGEIRGDLDRELVLDLIYGPMVYRLLVGQAPVNDAEAEQLIEAIFEGMRKRPEQSEK
jgi:AcrR family transcriptional regulator